MDILRLFILALLLLPSMVYGQYREDILGDGYLCRTIEMPDDYEGRVVCSLIKRENNEEVKRAILYVHGYNDYFFQKELGDSIVAHGYNFYALDLRKYGRSILPNQDPFFCKSLKEYFADIDTALAVIRSEGNDKIMLMAHSTGGLITPYYLASKGEVTPVDGLILNSPFLDWNFGWFMENIVLPSVSFIGKFFPDLVVQGSGVPHYANSLLSEEKGEWIFNKEWKMPNGHHKRAGWIRAIHEAQKELQNGVSISCPILVLSSDKSLAESNNWSDDYMKADIVLDVDDIQNYGLKLGKHVTRDTIKNGMHDLILSPKPYRDDAYRRILRWLSQVCVD